MNPQKNQDEKKAGLFDGIQSEVSAENAPLLEFITKYAGIIAGIVITLLLILGGMGAWRWYQTDKQKNALNELANIEVHLSGSEKNAALTKFAENAPDTLKIYAYMSLGKNALENNNPKLAADAYANAAKLGGDSSLGVAASFAEAGALLNQEDYSRAISILQNLEKYFIEPSSAIRLKEMLAEAAAAAGNKELAIKTYEWLGNEVKTPEGSYFRSRAEALLDSSK